MINKIKLQKRVGLHKTLIQDFGIPAVKIGGTNIRKEVIDDMKSLLHSDLRRTYANKGVAFVGRPEYCVAEWEGKTWVAIRQAGFFLKGDNECIQ